MRDVRGTCEKTVDAGCGFVVGGGLSAGGVFLIGKYVMCVGHIPLVIVPTIMGLIGGALTAVQCDSENGVSAYCFRERHALLNNTLQDNATNAVTRLVPAPVPAAPSIM